MTLRTVRVPDLHLRTQRPARFAIAAALAVPLLVLLAPFPTHAQNGGGPNFGPVRDADYLQNGNYDADLVALGRRLFFDEVLSGNRNISCATCHHPDNATGDALSLPLGEGGVGLGVARTTGDGRSRVRQRVPRNSPALFNLGARQFGRLFHGGRVAIDAGSVSGFATPAGSDLPVGLESVLAAQALFPVSTGAERVADTLRLCWTLAGVFTDGQGRFGIH